MAARLAKEYRALSDSLVSGMLPGVRELALVDDNLFVWQFEITASAFDTDLPQTAALRADLAAIKRATGHPDAIIMEARFPEDYPNSPFLLRVVSPHIKYLSGHVTAGGSICIEALTLSGSPGSWQPSFTVETVLATVLYNMANAETVIVQTATGPGGRSGPLAIDMSRGPEYAASPYPLHEAQQGYHRTLVNHGWGGGGGSTVAGAQRPVPRLGAAPQLNASQAAASTQFRPIKSSSLPARRKIVAPPPAPPAAPQPHRPASPTRHRAAPAPKPKPKRKAEVIDLTCMSDDDEEAGPARPARRPATAAAAVARPRAPTLEERLRATNERTGLNLPQPPSHWECTDVLLEGGLSFVSLPLQGRDSYVVNGAYAAVNSHGFRPKDVETLTDNGLSLEAAVAALEAAGGDIGAAVMAVAAANSGVDEEAVRVVMANGVRRADAEAAVKFCHSDADAALCFIINCQDTGVPPQVAVMVHEDVPQRPKLGQSMPGRQGLCRPDPGFHSTTLGGGIWAVYDNAHCYPAYCVHYK